MREDNEDVLVVERKSLFPTQNHFFEGFRPAGEADYEAIIERIFSVMIHKEASSRPDFKQPIAYVAIYNPVEKRLFVYQRAKEDKDYGEKGLQGKWSMGFGGHMKPLDRTKDSTIRQSLIREIGEETGLQRKLQNPRILGYINDESNDTNRVHFGMLYLMSTGETLLHPKDREIAKVELRSLNEMLEFSKKPDYDLEDWSRIALEPLRKLL